MEAIGDFFLETLHFLHPSRHGVMDEQGDVKMAHRESMGDMRQMGNLKETLSARGVRMKWGADSSVLKAF